MDGNSEQLSFEERPEVVVNDSVREGDIVAVRHRCDSLLCPRCRRYKGILVRQKLESSSALFADARMFTFTVDPKLIPTGYLAYRYVKDGKFIPRTMRYFGIKNWVCVLEFQRNGYPHWHLLVDCAEKVDVHRLHSLWLRWGIGSFVNVSYIPAKNPLHAVRYITKYLIKPDKNGLPDWVLDMQERIRVVSASRSVGALFPARPKITFDAPSLSVSRSDGRRRTYRERLNECGVMWSAWLMLGGRLVRLCDFDRCPDSNFLHPKIYTSSHGTYYLYVLDWCEYYRCTFDSGGSQCG